MMSGKASYISGIDNPLMGGPLSDEEVEAIKARQAAQDKLLENRNLAKYKIEVMFTRDFSLQKPSAGALTFWESGSKLHGGGDAVMHICPGKSLGRSECEAFIPDASHGLGFLICPSCLTSWDGKEVCGQLLFRLSIQKWAEVLHMYFMRLGGNADIVMKYYPGSLVSATEKEQNQQRYGEEFGKVRGKRSKRVYPLANIIKDTSAGADLLSRIVSFLKA